ncbi:MAG: zinc-binding dehydrogenase [Caulobacterales bacterium]|nr:zinc-binding dehydrogenase [Caulobacterales bacterium]
MAHESGLEMRTLAKPSGQLELSLVRVPTPEPGPDEIVVQVQAAPINPSDLGLLTGPADLSTLQASGSGENIVLTAQAPDVAIKMLAARFDQSLPIGNEGAGVVVKAGANAQALLGKTVAMVGGAMYAQYRKIKAIEVLPLPEGTTAVEGASCFVNPLTALAMVETLRLEGHKALVHTAAASNLGQMLNKICIKDGVPLVNIVRSEEQERILRDIGAKYVVNSTSPNFMNDLVAALKETEATLAFDAIGGGKLAGQILTAMEIAQNSKPGAYSRYGSAVHKQVYIYGRLDIRPTEIGSGVGMAWGASGFLLTYFLQKIGMAEANRLRQRVLAELKTTFASHYTRTISLTEALDPATLLAYSKKATGEKYLIDPTR